MKGLIEGGISYGKKVRVVSLDKLDKCEDGDGNSFYISAVIKNKSLDLNKSIVYRLFNFSNGCAIVRQVIGDKRDEVLKKYNGQLFGLYAINIAGGYG